MADRRETVTVDIRGADKGARDLRGLGRAADDTKDEISSLGKSFAPYVAGARAAERATEKLADAQERLARTARDANGRLRDSRGRFVGAGTRLPSSGAGRGGLGLPGIPAAGGVRAAQGGLRGALGGLSLPLSPTTLALAGVGGLAVSPAIGAGVSAAGLLGAGGLIAGGGIALSAATSKPVQAEFKGLAAQVADDATRMARAFEKPLIEVAQNTRREWRGVTDDIGRMFAKVAEAGGVQSFAAGLTGLIREMLPGLERAGEEFDEFGDAAARKLPELGQSISDMFDAFAEGSPGAVAFFEDLIDLVGATLEGIGNVSFGLSKVYEAMDKVRDNSLWGQFTQGVTGAVIAIRPAERAIQDFGEATQRAEDHVARLNEEFDELFGRVKDGRDAARDYQAAIDELTESFKANGTTLDITTEKGRENDAAVQKIISSIQAQREAAIAAGGGTAAATAAANAKYQEQLGLLEAQLRKLGATPAQIAAIVAAYQRIPTDVWTTVHVRADLRSIENVAEQMAVRLGRRAAGGPVMAGKTYLVGEQGPELVTFGDSGYVHDAAATRGMAGTGAGHGGAGGPSGGTVKAELIAGAGGTAVAEMIRYLVRTGALQLRVVNGKVSA